MAGLECHSLGSPQPPMNLVWLPLTTTAPVSLFLDRTDVRSREQGEQGVGEQGEGEQGEGEQGEGEQGEGEPGEQGVGEQGEGEQGEQGVREQGAERRRAGSRPDLTLQEREGPALLHCLGFYENLLPKLCSLHAVKCSVGCQERKSISTGTKPFQMSSILTMLLSLDCEHSTNTLLTVCHLEVGKVHVYRHAWQATLIGHQGHGGDGVHLIQVIR